MNTRDSSVPADESEIEKRLVILGAGGHRVTPELINSLVKDEQYHVFPGTTVTVCLITLENGFTVTGESACADPNNFDQQIGRDIAKRNARDKIWALEGYLLKQRMYEHSRPLQE